MAQSQYMGVGMEGSKSMNATSTPGTPGAIINPTKAATGSDPSAFGWKDLDYAFGTRPLYQLVKGLTKKDDKGGGFCGDDKKAAAGGMQNPASQMMKQQAANAMLAGPTMADTDAFQQTELPAATEMDYSGFV